MEYLTLDLAKGSGVVERRIRARLAVTALIFVKLGDVNGGIAFNISEDGLALSAANGLPEGQIPELTIQLPDSADWIRTSGQIKWRSNSNKECGIRYVGMSEEARRRIREWIAAEISSMGPIPEPESNGTSQNVQPESTAPSPGETVLSMGKEDQHATKALPAAEVGGDRALQETPPESDSAAIAATGCTKEEDDEDNGVADRGGILAHVSLDSANNLGRVEHRACERLAVSRRAVCSLIFVKLGDGNGGIVLNISEGGLALSAANSLSEDRIPELSIQLPGSRDWIRAAGLTTWRSNSNKKCGVRFFAMGEDARRRIREWIAAEMSGTDPAPEPGISSTSQNVKPESTAPTRGDTGVSVGKEDQHATKAAPVAEVMDNRAHQETPPESDYAAIGATGSTKKEDEEDKVASDSRILPAPIFPVNPHHAEAVLDRRIHPRKRIIPLGYVQLGNGNGGIALNLSEGGLSITAANPLPQDNLPSIRLQSPDNTRSVHAKGEIVWRSESKREAGVRFVDLTEQARVELRNWLSSPAAPLAVERQPEPTLRTKKDDFHPTSLSSPELLGQGRIPDSSLSPKVPEKAPTSPPPVVEISPAVSVLPAAPPSVESRSEPVRRQLGVIRVRIKGRVQAWTAAVAVLMLVGSASFIKEWLSSRPRGTKRMVEVVVPKEPVQSEGAEVAPQLRAANSATASQPQGPAALQTPNGKNSPSGIMPTTPSKELPGRVGGALLSLAAKAPKERVRDIQESPGLNQGNTESSASIVSVLNPALLGEQPRMSTPPTPWQQEEARLSPALIPILSPPRDAEATGPAKNGTESGVEGRSLPKRAEPAMRINGTVTIRTDPYPSIRFSGKPNGKKSRGTASLRLGQLLSHVEPPYPEEAMQKGVQGTVKIHVIVSPEGTIGQMVSVDGPPLLVPATVGAVQQWRYSQTLLAGQPVETEDNIAVTFGLSIGGNR